MNDKFFFKSEYILLNGKFLAYFLRIINKFWPYNNFVMLIWKPFVSYKSPISSIFQKIITALFTAYTLWWNNEQSLNTINENRSNSCLLKIWNSG